VIYFTQINTPLFFAEEKCLWIVIIITSHHTHSDWAWIKKSSVIFKAFVEFWMGIKESSLCYVRWTGSAKCAMAIQIDSIRADLNRFSPSPKKGQS
jgi:hypothetical protein